MDIEEKQKVSEEPEETSSEEYFFLQEVIKENSMTRKQLAAKAVRMIGYGLIFGVAASLIFGALQPWIQTRYAKKTEEITLQSDEEGKKGETEVSKNTDDTGNAGEGSESDGTQEEKDMLKLTKENYAKFQGALHQKADKAKKSIAEVIAYTNDADMQRDTYIQSQSVAGAIVADNEQEVLILADSSVLKMGGRIGVKFLQQEPCEGFLKKKNENLGIAVFSVQKSAIETSVRNEICTVVLGDSALTLPEEVTIAAGKPFGYAGGIGYGLISTVDNTKVLPDNAYKYMTTDITGEKSGSGFLFNLNGEIVGMMKPDLEKREDMQLISAYAISSFKKEIELMLNGKSVPYMGIIAAEVPEDIKDSQKIPDGIYVKEVMADSPAMKAGIQSGDVLMQMGETAIVSLEGYHTHLLEQTVGTKVIFQGKRTGNTGYEAVEFHVEIGSKE